jgi:hypothetical protein
MEQKSHGRIRESCETSPKEVTYAWTGFAIRPFNMGTGRGLGEVTGPMQGLGHGD